MARTRIAQHVPAVAALVDPLPSPSRLQLTGSLLFADVSGFTALSERLARRGKEGSEAITAVISDTFDGLLSEALGLGGDLLRFGGDAFLLLFLGDGHRTRARDAASTMQRKVGSGGASTSDNRIGLRMSAGIASGSVDVVVVGERHRELVIAGSTLDRVLELEREAEPGETRIDDDERAFGPEAPPAGTPKLDPAVYLPEAVRRVVESEEASAEHRPVAVGFGKVTGLDQLTEHPAETIEALHRVVCAVDELSDLHGVSLLGTDVSVGALKMVLAAGAPTAFGENEERLIRMARAAVERNLALPLRFGIATGHVFAGEVGTRARRVYTVMGDTVNLAARLVERADRGEVLATERVLDRARTRFDVTRRAPMEMKGKELPIAPFSVGELATAKEFQELPLVGREQELAVLRRAVDATRNGDASLIEIVGPAGVGKTRLVTELVTRARIDVISLECEEYGRTDLFGTARRLMIQALSRADPRELTASIVEGIVGRVAPHLRPWLPLLGPVLDLPFDETRETSEIAPEFRRDRLHWLAAEMLLRLLDEPTLIVFEVSHWMDAASAELMMHVLRRAEEMPWMVLLTRRPAYQGLWLGEELDGHTMELGPLSSEAARKLLQHATAESPVLSDVEQALVERSGGNPFFLLGLTRARQEELPETVEGVAAARIDELPPAPRRLLRSLAVLGQRFPLELARAVTSEQAVDTTAVATTELTDFVALFDDHAEFRHSLFRETAYEGLPYRTRRELHARVAQWYEMADTTDSGLLSLHYERAGMWEPAWRHSVAAGHRARQIHATREAIDFYERALRVARRLRSIEPLTVAAVAEALGDVCDLMGRHEKAEAAYRLGRRHVATPADEARLMMKIGMLAERRGRYPLALRWLTLARRRLDDPRHPLTVELDIARAGIRFRQDRFREAVELCDLAIDRAKRTSLNQVSLEAELAHAYYLRGHARSLLEEDPSTEDHERALAIYEEIDDIVGQSNVYNNLGLEAYYRGEWDRAIDFHRGSEELRQRAGNIPGAAASAFNRGLVLFDQGRMDEAEQAFEEVRRVGAAARSPVLEGAASCYLAAVASREGDGARAQELFRRSLDLLEPIGAEFFINDVRLKQAESHLLLDDIARARDAAVEGITATEGQAGMEASMVGFQRVLGLTDIRLGNWEQAESNLRRAAELAAAQGLRYEAALAAVGRAVIAKERSEDPTPYERERDRLVSELGIVRLPSFFAE